jgi:4-hydroxybenzoate polyprenyltransferase
VVIAHFCAGAGAALFLEGRVAGQWPIGSLVLGAILWAVFLNGGTLAINSAFDRDEGDIGYLNSPPPIPAGLGWVAVVLMFGGLALAYTVNWAFFVCYAICLFLSLLYSVPPIRLKAVAGADLVVNMIGYGALTFAAGAASAGNLQVITWVLAASFAFLFAAFYPMTQIYQVPEDSARGDRTLAIIVGPRRVLLLSLAALIVTLGLQQWAAFQADLGAAGAMLLAVPTLLWLVFTFHWFEQFKAYPHQAGMYRALRLWALSDVVVVAAFWWFSRI